MSLTWDETIPLFLTGAGTLCDGIIINAFMAMSYAIA